MISTPTKVLAILSTTGYYGKERANLKVYQLLKDHGIYLRIVLNKKATPKLLENFDGFNTIRINFPDLKQGRFDRQISRVLLNFDLWRVINNYKPDYLYMSDENVAFSVALILKRFKGKIIYRIGDELNLDRYGKRKFLYAFVWRKMVFKSINAFVSVSKFIKSTLEKEGRNNPEDCIIYNYPPFRNNALTSQLSVDKKKDSMLNLGYIGRFDKEKGCDHFVKAAIKILHTQKNVYFYLAGRLKDDAYSNEIVQMAEPYRENIIFLGEIEDIKGFYELVDVVCIPSVYQEPLSNIIIEARQNSTPSIIYPSGGMPEIVRHKTDGFICDQSKVKCLTEGMKYYLENRTLVPQHGKNAFEGIEEMKMGYENYKNSWLSVFNIETAQ